MSFVALNDIPVGTIVIEESLHRPSSRRYARQNKDLPKLMTRGS